MKKIIVLFCFIVFYFGIHILAAQTFRVVKIQGNARISKTKKIIKVNDVLKDKDNIVFDNNDENNFVRLRNTQNGQAFVVKPKAKNEQGILSYLWNLFVGKTNTIGTSTRNANVNIDDIRRYLAGDTMPENPRKFLIINEMSFKVPTKFSDDITRNRIIIKYKYQNETITKVLPIKEKRAIFHLKNILGENYKNTTDIECIIEEYSENKIKTYRQKLKLLFLDIEKEIKDEYEVLKNDKEAISKIQKYIFGIYDAYIDENQIKQIVK